jgi:hypothetical protein
MSWPPLRFCTAKVTVALCVAARGPDRPPLDTVHDMGACTTSPSAVSYRGSAMRREKLAPARREDEVLLLTMSRCSARRARSLVWRRDSSMPSRISSSCGARESKRATTVATTARSFAVMTSASKPDISVSRV